MTPHTISADRPIAALFTDPPPDAICPAHPVATLVAAPAPFLAWLAATRLPYLYVRDCRLCPLAAFLADQGWTAAVLEDWIEIADPHPAAGGSVYVPTPTWARSLIEALDGGEEVEPTPLPVGVVRELVAAHLAT